MRVDHFDYELPEERVALRPAEPRDAARLLVIRPGERFQDCTVRDLPAQLRPKDVLVLNDTKVIPSRLHGLRVRDESAARVEILLHERRDSCRWLAFARPAKKLKVGDRIRFGDRSESTACELARLDAEVESVGEAGEVALRFAFAGPVLEESLARIGEIPLPPYIARRRAADERDASDYQTVYAREEGAVAAPTAGLHLTNDLLRRLGEIGVGVQYVTLHVGAGTFLPVRAHDTSEHRLHPERGYVAREAAAAINEARAQGGRIVAVGTSSLRLLETAASTEGMISPYSGDTNIFITPGFRFRAVDALMTNFHLPRSTLLMLVAAFAGLSTIQSAYRWAIENGYRFYSYGDASLIFRE